jgi:hypothetical protein
VQFLSSCFLKLGISRDGQRQGHNRVERDLDQLSKVISNGFCHKEKFQPFADAAFEYIRDNFQMYSPKVYNFFSKKTFFLTLGTIQVNGDLSLMTLKSQFSLKYRGTRKI